jgi:hypothetical protein
MSITIEEEVTVADIDEALAHINLMLKTDEYDYNGNTMNYPDYSPFSNHKKTIMDGLDQDISVMVQQQNNIYMVGSITLVTLLICAIFIGSQK